MTYYHITEWIFNSNQVYILLLVTLPGRCRTEGRITIVYSSDDQVNKYHLAFTESIDSYDLRSTVSIGYVGYDPVKYFTRRDHPTIRVKPEDGTCVWLGEAGYFVDEINWFVKKLINVPLSQFTADMPHMVGPTGIFGALNSMGTSQSQVSFIIE